MGLKRFGIILTGLALAAAGGAGWVSSGKLQESQAHPDPKVLQALRGTLERAFAARLETLQVQAAALVSGTAPSVRAEAGILRVGQLGLGGASSSAPQHLVRTPGAPSLSPVEEETAWAQARAALAQVARGPATQAPVWLRSQDQVALAFPQAGSNGESRWAVAWLDPSSSFALFSGLEAGGSLRAFLATEDGRVLAHSQAALAGADVSESRSFVEALRAGASGTFMSQGLDRLPVQVSSVRLSGFPLLLVVEDVTLAAAIDWTRGARSLGTLVLGLLLLGGTLVLALGRGAAKTSPLPAELPRADAPAGATAAGPVAHRVGSRMVESGLGPEESRELQGLREQFETLRDELEKHRRIEERVNRFEKEALALRNPRLLATRMAEVASEICGSPALVLLHDERLHALVLAADCGFAQGQAPVGLSCPVSPELTTRIQQDFARGELSPLTGHEPLAQVLMRRAGVAHFEAWALAGFGPLGRATRRARLLGALVILQSGVDSFNQREHLGRMMRATGLVYENAILTSNPS